MCYWFEAPFALIETPTSKLPRTQKPDVFEEVATDMALAHNLFIRGLNAIYVQAPFVRAKDQMDFCNFMNCFLLGIEAHHLGEEERFFPAVERMAGEPGIMEKNVEQHHAFLGGMGKFDVYVKACLAGSEKYDGNRVVDLIDDFGDILREHLNDEIDTLLGLRKYGEDKMQTLYKELEEEGKKITRNTGFTTGVPTVLACHDTTFEGGIWSGFPAAPKIVVAVFRHIVFRIHASWWKFLPCSKNGLPRPLPYARV